MNLVKQRFGGLKSAAFLACFGVFSAGLSFATDYQCYVAESQSMICPFCNHPCPTCYTWGKCGNPGNSGRCEGPVYDGNNKKCVGNTGVRCPGRGKIWGNPEQDSEQARQDCENDGQFPIVDQATCANGGDYYYDTAETVADPTAPCD